MKQKILKQVFALALGGALTGAAGATIDPEHFKSSFTELGKLAGAGAVAAVWTLNIRAPKDHF